MQALEMAGDSFADEAEEPIRVWIESGDGSIARGVADVVSEDGALVRLDGRRGRRPDRVQPQLFDDGGQRPRPVDPVCGRGAGVRVGVDAFGTRA